MLTRCTHGCGVKARFVIKTYDKRNILGKTHDCCGKCCVSKNDSRSIQTGRVRGRSRNKNKRR